MSEKVRLIIKGYLGPRTTGRPYFRAESEVCLSRVPVKGDFILVSFFELEVESVYLKIEGGADVYTGGLINIKDEESEIIDGLKKAGFSIDVRNQ